MRVRLERRRQQVLRCATSTLVSLLSPHSSLLTPLSYSSPLSSLSSLLTPHPSLILESLSRRVAMGRVHRPGRVDPSRVDASGDGVGDHLVHLLLCHRGVDPRQLQTPEFIESDGSA